MRRLLIACALLATAVAAPPAQATFPGTNGRILFDHGGSIYSVEPDGSGLTQITRDANDATPDWSPDARSIAFVRDANGEEPPNLAVWTAAADGSGARQLTPDDDQSADFYPRFMPDGQSLLFQNCLGDDCDGGIFAVGTDGTPRAPITPNSGESYNWPAPSPDGRRIAFMRWHVGGVLMRIYVTDTQGKHQRAITPIRLEGWAPDWAPDGQSITFTSNNYVNRPGASLYSIPVDGKRRRAHRLTKPRFPHSDSGGSYSPDQKQIVFISDRRAARLNHTDLFVMSADGSGIHKVPLPFRDVFNPRWGVATP